VDPASLATRERGSGGGAESQHETIAAELERLRALTSPTLGRLSETQETDTEDCEGWRGSPKRRRGLVLHEALQDALLGAPDITAVATEQGGRTRFTTPIAAGDAADGCNGCAFDLAFDGNNDGGADPTRTSADSASTAYLLVDRIATNILAMRWRDFVTDLVQRESPAPGTTPGGGDKSPSSAGTHGCGARAGSAVRGASPQETADSVCAAYGATLLVTLSLGAESRRLAVAAALLRAVSAAAAVAGDLRPGDGSVAVVVPAALEAAARKKLGARPVGYLLALLQEFVFFQSEHCLLTQENLFSLHTLVETARKENRL
jgi:hypothetical protein